MDRERLYMIALMPPTEMTREIEAIRQEFAEAYQCNAALKPPVHITMHAPYKEFESHEQKVKAALIKWAAMQPSFDLSLDGFGSFKNNGVIFINVEKTEALKQLHKGLSALMTKTVPPDIKSQQTFNPHITIGYRDIPKDLFPQALADYTPRKYKANFKVDHIYFWRHNGKSWETIATIPLSKNDNTIKQQALF